MREATGPSETSLNIAAVVAESVAATDAAAAFRFRASLRAQAEDDRRRWYEASQCGETPREKCAREAREWEAQQATWREIIRIRAPYGKKARTRKSV